MGTLYYMDPVLRGTCITGPCITGYPYVYFESTFSY